MAGHDLIDGYLTALRRRLPADAVDELADGLMETYARHRASGLDPDAAAEAAIAEFGAPQVVLAAFLDQSQARRLARALMITGPAVGLCWAAALISRHAWTWPVPNWVRLAFGAVLLTAVVCLVLTYAGRGSLRRPWSIAVGGLGLLGLDAGMLTTVTLIGPGFTWPLAVAAIVSATRMTLTARTMSQLIPR